MTTFIVISLSLVGFIAFGAAIFALAELMAKGDDYAEALNDDPTRYGGQRDRTERHVSAPPDRQSHASADEIRDGCTAYSGDEVATAVPARPRNHHRHVEPAH